MKGCSKGDERLLKTQVLLQRALEENAQRQSGTKLAGSDASLLREQNPLGSNVNFIVLVGNQC